jgi:hypothetical protein
MNEWMNESKSLTETAICYFINNCQNIESISLFGKFLITCVTIDALIALAVRKPKICFKHCFRLSDELRDETKRTLYENRFDKPNNLRIEFLNTS